YWHPHMLARTDKPAYFAQVLALHVAKVKHQSIEGLLLGRRPNPQLGDQFGEESSDLRPARILDGPRFQEMNKPPEPAAVGLLCPPIKMSLSQSCDQRRFPRRLAEVISTQRRHSSHDLGLPASPKKPI